MNKENLNLILEQDVMRKVKYTIKIKPPYNKSLICPKCKQILWIPLWEKTFKGNCNCKRLSKYE